MAGRLGHTLSRIDSGMKDARILVATNNASDAELVRDLLRDEFANVVVSTDPDKAVDDFDCNKPAVLILAFNTLEKAERYYLGLYRLSTTVHSVAHRTLILCSKGELQRVYELCRKEYFDDYVLFWPMTNDVQRLSMAVTHALRELERSQDGAPAAEMARQLRRIAELEQLLERQPGQADLHADTACRSHKQGAAEIDALKTLAENPRPLVLVVDDDEFERKLAGEMLRAVPYDLIFAASGAEALSLVCKTRPDLILMDMVMPAINGLETLRSLKASRFADIPVVMITGQSEKDVVMDCLKAGAADFLVKPLDREVLLKKVDRFLAGYFQSLARDAATP